MREIDGASVRADIIGDFRAKAKSKHSKGAFTLREMIRPPVDETSGR